MTPAVVSGNSAEVKFKLDDDPLRPGPYGADPGFMGPSGLLSKLKG